MISTWIVIAGGVVGVLLVAAALFAARRVERDCASFNYPPLGSRIPVPPARDVKEDGNAR